MSDHCDRILYKVRDVIDALGGTNAAAERMGVSPPAVSWWLSNGRFPPARFLEIRAALIEIGRDVDPTLFQKTSESKGEADAA
jgi:DNA-binding transcriptional regulator YdaS (Cro superfamily)